MAEPGVPNQALDAGKLSQETADHHDDQSAQKSVSQQLLSAGLPACDHRSQKNSSRQIGSNNPKEAQLQMPGADDIKGKKPSQINSEKGLQIGAIVFCSSSQ